MNTKVPGRWSLVLGPWSLVVLSLVAACNRGAPAPVNRASGYVEATEVRVAGEVGGRLIEVKVAEGDRVSAGDVIARIDTSDTELALRRAGADRDQAQAQLALVRAGSRPEDIRQAAAQVQSAQAEEGRASGARRGDRRPRTLRAPAARQRGIGQAAG